MLIIATFFISNMPESLFLILFIKSYSLFCMIIVVTFQTLNLLKLIIVLTVHLGPKLQPFTVASCSRGTMAVFT